MEIGTKTILKTIALTVAAWAFILIIIRIKEPLIWILIAGFLATGLEPVIGRLSKYTRRRGLAIAVVMLVVVGVFALLAAKVVPPLVSQTQEIVTSLPTLETQLKASNSPAAKILLENNVLDTVKDNREQIISFVTKSFGTIFAGSINLIGISVTIFILMVYFITGAPGWIETIKKSRYGPRYKQHEQTLRQMANAVSSYVVGNAITSAVAFTSALVILVLLGIGMPLPLAFIYGIFDIIPMIGATLGGILLVSVALFKSLTAAIIMLVFILVYQQVESAWLQPRVYGQALSLPNVIVMIAAIIGGALAGLIGALLAIPLAACIRVAFLAYINREAAPSRL